MIIKIKYNIEYLRSHLFLLGILDSSLLRTSHLLHSVLSLLALLAWHPLGLHEAVTSLTMLGLELLGKVERVVDERKACALATAEDGAKAETEDNVRLGLVHASQLLTDFGLLYRRFAWMQNVNNLFFCCCQFQKNIIRLLIIK